MDGGLWRRMTTGLIIRNAARRHITVSQPSRQADADPGSQNDLIWHFGEDLVMKQLLLAAALIAFPVAVFSGVEHLVMGAAAAPAQQGTAPSPGDLSKFSAIARDTQRAAATADLVTAETRITHLQAKGAERCNADDDRRADACPALALALLTPAQVIK